MLLMILFEYRWFKYDFNLRIVSIGIATQHKWKTVCLHFTPFYILLSLIIKNTSFMKEVQTHAYTQRHKSPIQGKLVFLGDVWTSNRPVTAHIYLTTATNATKPAM